MANNEFLEIPYSKTNWEIVTDLFAAHLLSEINVVDQSRENFDVVIRYREAPNRSISRFVAESRPTQ